MNCHEFEDLMADVLYGDIDDDTRKRFDAHAGSCSACAATLAETRSTLGIMSRRKRPDPGQAYWDGYWNRLSARIEAEQSRLENRSWLSRLFPRMSHQGARWAYRGVLAMVLIAFGAFLGRMVIPGSGPDHTLTPGIGIVEAPGEKDTAPGGRLTTGAGTPGIQMTSAEACAYEYIDDAQVLLLGLINFDPATESEYLDDWSVEKTRSRELIAQAASLKGDLRDPKQRRLRDLVTELEFILLQIATLESTGDLESVEMIQSSVKDRGILLKINLEKLRSDNMEKPEPGAFG